MPRALPVLAPVLALAFAVAAPVAAQSARAGSVLDSYARATALLDSAVRAHGGLEAVRSIRRGHFRMEGNDYHRNQSVRVEEPFDSTLSIREMWLDVDRGQMVAQNTSGFPGGFYYTNRFMTDGERHLQANVRAGTHSPRDFPPAAQQYGNLFQVPQGYLIAALESNNGLRRHLGRIRLSSGAEVEAISYFIPNTVVTIGLDPSTHLMRAVLGVGPDALHGDAANETEYLDYARLGTLLMPRRTTIRRAGALVRELRYLVAEIDVAIPDTLLRPPTGSREVPPPPPAVDTVRTLAPGVWAIRTRGTWSMLAEFRDHLLVVDAAPNTPAGVRARAAELAPGKPIRFVVPTHHHEDHFSGVRAYAAAGATTVTTRGNAAYFRRIVSAPGSTMARAGEPQPEATLEIVAGRSRSFSDGSRTVEIHDIGPSPHANEMLIAWVPSAGVLFASDLIEAPDGTARPGANAETTQHLDRFLREKGWTVRTFLGGHGFLSSPAEFDALVRMPLVAPR